MIILPTIITKDVWFYEDNKELLEPHLGKPYVSYSTVNSWTDESYRPDFFKRKFAGINIEAGIYADFGSYVGEGVENGFLDPNEKRFLGAEYFDLIPRPEGAIYERFVLLDFGDFIFIGFIDVFYETPEGVVIYDLKTGGKGKREKYDSPDYLQIPLYVKSLEEEGLNVVDQYVWYVTRKGNHKTVLELTDDQFRIDIKYNKTISKKAITKVKRAVKEISSYYQTYLKFLK